LIALAIIAAVIGCAGCGASDPPVGSETVMDRAAYLKVNDYTRKMMQQYAKGIFPEQALILPEECIYYYRYDCALLGDPHCMVYLRSDYSDKSIFEAEIQRLETLAVQTVDAAYTRKLYSANLNIDETLVQYMDEQIYDGSMFVFECAVADMPRQRIDYLFAIVWDGQPYCDKLTEVLEGIYV